MNADRNMCAWLLAVLLVAQPQTSPAAGGFEDERYYSDLLCARWGGSPTVLPSGVRPDCETEFAVMEFDWAKRPKNYECIGQAVVYAVETGKTPVCVLLARDDDELQFGRRQFRSIRRAGVIPRLIDVRQIERRPK